MKIGSGERGGVIISESFSRLSDDLGSGHLPWRAFRDRLNSGWSGFYDYTTEHGLVMMDRSTFIKPLETGRSTTSAFLSI